MTEILAWKRQRSVFASHSENDTLNGAQHCRLLATTNSIHRTFILNRKAKKNSHRSDCFFKYGRNGRIRTCDPHTPSVVRYQTALRPDLRGGIIPQRIDLVNYLFRSFATSSNSLSICRITCRAWEDSSFATSPDMRCRAPPMV